jgi:hypothetical protein
MPYKVVKPKVWPFPEDCGGMNGPAAREGGLKWPYDDNTVAIQRGQGAVKTRNTVLHETVEAERMKQGECYRTAHRRALAFERGARERRNRR